MDIIIRSLCFKYHGLLTSPNILGNATIEDVKSQNKAEKRLKDYRKWLASHYTKVFLEKIIKSFVSYK